MTIRWRLGAFLIQTAALLAVTAAVTGRVVSAEVWFGSVVALIINKQLLEPYFARPVDTLANSALALLAITISSSEYAEPAWLGFRALLIAAVALALLAIFLGAGSRTGGHQRIGAAATALIRKFNAPVIYSVLFWLSLVEYSRGIQDPFWPLSLAWLLPLVIGTVNWPSAITSLKGDSLPGTVEGMVGPSRLLISTNSAPPPGTRIDVLYGQERHPGVVVSRIRRRGDVWADVHMDDPDACEGAVLAKTIGLRINKADRTSVIGVVETSSTHASLSFSPLRDLEIGRVVAVAEGDRHVLYQISSAQVTHQSVRGGGVLGVQATAAQLGVFNPVTRRIQRHGWVPRPGAYVILPERVPDHLTQPQDDQFLIGHVVGTNVPVFLESAGLCEGHLVILGMTRMGKSTLALRLANTLAAKHSVIVFDQTGEYRARSGLQVYEKDKHDNSAGLAVFEPAPGKCVADEGLQQLRHIANTGFKEYEKGDPFRRVLLIDEAHQFVPEPALLGFGAPGRESAIAFGMHMMQIRKYGVTAILISQRTAVVAKSALSQCENVIAFKSVDKTGLDYLESIVGSDARDLLPSFNQGQALVFGPAMSTDTAVAVQVYLD